MDLQEAKISDLKVCGLSDALGIDVPPVFQWALSDCSNQCKQHAYRIRVASTEEGLQDGQSDLWDSGWIVSAETFDILYEGKPLPAATICYWQVEVKLEQGGAVIASEIGIFATGLPQNLWKGCWIGIPKGEREPEKIGGNPAQGV